MKIRSKILASMVASIAVAATVALVAFTFLRGMNDELARSGLYTEIIDKTHALNVLVASAKEGPSQSQSRQLRSILASLDNLLKQMTPQDPFEEALIGQLVSNNRELVPLIGQISDSGQSGLNELEKDRRNVLASQIWMKVRFISDDTYRLNDIAQSRIAAAQHKTGITIIGLILLLALATGAIYYFSGRDILRAHKSLLESEEALRKSRDELEDRVRERTAELETANEYLRSQARLLDLAHDAVLVRDLNHRTTFWNHGAEVLYGFTREEVLGKPIHEFLRTDFPEPFDDIIEKVGRTGNWEGELRHHTGFERLKIVDSRWALQTGQNGELVGYLEVNRDITARKMAEEAFGKTDRAFRTLSECNQALVRQASEIELLQQVCRIVVGVGGYRMAWVGLARNDEGKAVEPVASAGYDQGYLEQAAITWADTERGGGPTGTAIRTGKITSSQNALINPFYAPWRSEGIKRGYAASIALPLVVERKIIGALTIYASEPDAFDEAEAGLLSNLADNLAYGISSIRIAEERRRSGEELKQYASRLEVINQELQDFAFIASHDLQEPLRKIQTFCDLAQRRCASALDSTGQQYLDRVVNSAIRMRQLLNDLLEFSRAAEQPGSFKTINLEEIVQDAADIFEEQLKVEGGTVEVTNMPEIEANESQMLRLFQNLIGNALKYRGDEDPRIRISANRVGQGDCEICVRDNGIGFDPQYTDVIFKPFQRLHGRKEYGGTGMGLAICRKIVERHRGGIDAESEPGKGTVFKLRLPLKQPGREGV